MARIQVVRGVIWLSSLISLAACSDTTTYSKHIDPRDPTGYGPVYSLPRAYISLNAVSDADKLVLKWEPQLFPDNSARFKVVWDENEFSDDHFTIGINNKGLLTTLNSTNTDETPKIITKVIQLAEEAMGLPSNLVAEQKKGPKAPRKFNITVLIDPFDTDSVKRANRTLRANEANLVLNVTRADRSSSYEDQLEIKAAANNCQGSLCFRLLTPIIMSASIQSETLKLNVVDNYLAIVPDPIAVGWYDIRRGPCIKRDTQLSFADGSISKLDLDKPSEVLNCLQIPLDIGKAVLSVPAALLTVKVNQAKSETDYLQSQINLLNAQAALLAAEAKAAAHPK